MDRQVIEQKLETRRLHLMPAPHGTFASAVAEFIARQQEPLSKGN
jgi:hypothetical protein